MFSHKDILMTCAALGAILLPARASAQGGAPATSAVPSSTALGEVVVTARRRAEDLQKVPVAVTALTNAALRRDRIGMPEDVQYFTPGLSVQGGGFNRAGNSYAIRGQSAGGTIVYRDEVPGLNESSIGGSLAVPYYDLSSIQVLRGPQGTLFGGTTTGGAVLVSTAKPQNQFGGYIQATVGNLNAHYLEGAINVPIVDDKVLLRVAADLRRRDGYTINIFNSEHIDNQNTDSVRMSLTLRPTSFISNDLVYEYNLRDERIGNTHAFLCNPNGTLNGAVVDPQTNALISSPGFAAGTWAAQCQANAALGPRYVNADVTGLGRIEEDLVSNVTTLTFNHDLLLKNIFGYVRDSTLNRQDADGTTFALSEVPNPYADAATNTTQQYTDELQLQGKSLGDHLDWIVGGYHQLDNDPNYNHLLAAVGLPVLFNVFSKTRATEDAVFAQATYDFSPLVRGLSFTAGVRGTRDQNTTLNGVNACLPQAASPSAPSCSATFAPPFSTADFDAGTVRNAISTSATTYNVTVDYKPTDAVFVYVTTRHGYRPGGVQPFAPVAFQIYRPETVNDWELGIKSHFHAGGMPVRVNIAGFFDNYQDVQRTADIAPTTAVTINAQRAKVRGVEIEATAAPTPWLTVTANYAFLDASYTKFIDPVVLALNAANGTDFSADESKTPFPLAPRNTLNVNAAARLPLPETLGAMSLSANYSYRDTTYFSTDGYQTAAKQGSYALVNLQLEWANVCGKGIDLTAFAKNLMGKVYIDGTGNLSYAFNPAQSTGVDTVFYGEPRTFGLQLRYQWGGG